ncbi:MAG: hypothetical protein EOQ93_03180 [Mesorhizobium sp.]|nr:MAG: hypothetical protein EOQ93_03180 [Mesorhizobium sp.]
MTALTYVQKLKRDLETLVESVRLDIEELAKADLTKEDREAVRKHMTWCQNEHRELLRKFEKAQPEEEPKG